MKYEHGTLGAAKIDGCGCGACHDAERQYANRRYRLMAYGRWQPYVDAQPVREHVATLQAFGLGWMTIAAISGVPRGSVSKLIYGDSRRGMAPSKRVRPFTAAAILAIEPTMDALADGAMVDGCGTRRRVQALVAVGWAQNRLAEHLGMDRASLNRSLRGSSPVRCGTARAVRSLYDELWDQPPPEATHRDKISASRARNYARERGWLPPQAWDDDLLDLTDAELEAEIARRVDLMNDEELRRCHYARYRLGDRTPLIMAAAKEADRRRVTARKAAA